MDTPFVAPTIEIDANLGLKTDPRTPPDAWVDLLAGYALKIRRVMATWRRGSAKYQPIPNFSWEFAPIDPKDTGSENTDGRLSDIRAWARATAQGVWAACLEYASTNGRPMDVQIVALEFSEAKQEFKTLGAKAKNIPSEDGIAATANDLVTGGEPKILAWVIASQQAALDRANARGDAVYGKLESLLTGMERAMGLAFSLIDRSIADREAYSASAAAERKEQRELVARLVEGRQHAETIGRVVDTIGPILEDLAQLWIGDDGSGGGSAWQRRAGSLVDSVTPEQIDAARSAGVLEVVEDVLSMLRAIKAESNREKAQAIVIQIAGRVKQHTKPLAAILSDDQRASLFVLFRFAGLQV